MSAGPERDNEFERHGRVQARAWLERSHRERLEWLEQAKRFAAKALDAAQRRRLGRGRTKDRAKP